MIFVVGGMASGKRHFVRSLGYRDTDMGTGIEDAHPVVLGVDELVRQRELTEREIGLLLAKEVITMTEIGQGIVPLERSERAWRERAGTLAQLLAREADATYRMVCGIAIRLEGKR